MKWLINFPSLMALSASAVQMDYSKTTISVTIQKKISERPSGRKIEVEIAMTDTMGSLKAEIEKRLNFPPESQKIISYNGPGAHHVREFEDKNTFEGYFRWFEDTRWFQDGRWFEDPEIICIIDDDIIEEMQFNSDLASQPLVENLQHYSQLPAQHPYKNEVKAWTRQQKNKFSLRNPAVPQPKHTRLELENA